MSVDVKPESGASLSALMDGEGGDFEIRRTLGLVSRDPELRRKWDRYHLAATAMRGELVSPGPDLSANIAAALDSEPAPRNRTALRVVGRVAVAASVAFMTVVGVRYLTPISGSGRNAEVAARQVSGDQGMVARLPSQQIPLDLRLPPVRVATASDAVSTPIAGSGPLVVGIAPAVEQRELRGMVAQRLPSQGGSVAANRPEMYLARPQETQQRAGR